MNTCIYLRKSRADIEAEKEGEFETLHRHKTTLLKIAKERNLNIVEIKEELVSGEHIEHRPRMIELLDEVKNKKYDAVLVMDIDRLGRGDMQDQGLILDTFKTSNTKIITPRKTYDLQDEFDEEYSEFEAFMARKELKLINRRLQRGRIKSVEDGNYIGSAPPFGYDILKKGKERTLVPNSDADAVKLIFDLYVNNSIGARKIAIRLNYLGYKTNTGKEFYPSAVLNILKNKVYCGYVQWRKKEEKKSKDPNKKTDVRTRPIEEWIEAKGKHTPIISEELFNQAQLILKGKYHTPYHLDGITNPLAGIIKCGKCGGSMVYRTYTTQSPHIICYNACGNKSSNFKYVEEKLLYSIKNWLFNYKLEFASNDLDNNKSTKDIHLKLIKSLQSELKTLESQRDKLHDLLERDIYDLDTYMKRNSILSKKIEDLNKSLLKANEDLFLDRQREIAKKNIIPSFEEVLELYPYLEDVTLKNQMLKSILKCAVYIKEKNQSKDNFSLVIHPKID